MDKHIGMKTGLATVLVLVVMGGWMLPAGADDDDGTEYDTYGEAREQEQRDGAHHERHESRREHKQRESDDDESGGRNGMVPPDARTRPELKAAFDAWKAECSSCHMAYPPRLLPADSWRVLMDGLSGHFGSDASLDQETVDRILPFLAHYAGRQRRRTTDKPVLRITETRWFRKEHDEIGSSVWKRPGIGSPSNCMACHTGAGQGDFDEDTVRIPR